MIKYLKRLDAFTKNIVIVFIGTSLANFLNLLYQLLLAHKLSAAEFAAFNSLLSIFMLVSSPLGTIQMAIAKYSAEFNANNEAAKLKFLLTDLLKKAFILAISTLLIFWFASVYIMNTLKIPSLYSGYFLAGLLALAWLIPLLSGAVQGLEFFGWLTFGSLISAALKLALAFLFILLGYSIAGAMGAFLIGSLISVVVYYFPLRHFIHSRPENLALQGKDEKWPLSINHNRPRPLGRGSRRLISLKAEKEALNYKEMFVYLLPVAISNFCFIALVSFDMVLVKYFFTPDKSGLYSLAQLVGKIFLFLPGAISIVMFPRVSGLNARNLGTASTLKRSFFYVLVLCILASVFYNFFPSFVLKILTGKVYPESIILGRLFSISMSFFSILYIFIAYFLSLRDFRFIKYLVLATILQFAAIALFHKNLIQVQVILCINAILLFCIHCLLVAFKKSPQ